MDVANPHERAFQASRNIPIKKLQASYTYLVPEKLSFLTAGCRVIVPFGRRLTEGFILTIHEVETLPETEYELKTVIDCLDIKPYFSPQTMQISRFISTYYLCTPAEAMRLFIPGKNSLQMRDYYYAATEKSDKPFERQIQDCLWQSPGLLLRDLKKKLGESVPDLDRCIAQMLRKKLIY